MKSITFANGFVEHFNVLEISPQARAMDHRGVFGSIAQGHYFLNAFAPHGHKGLSGYNVVTDVPLWVDHKLHGEETHHGHKKQPCCYYDTPMGRP